VPVTTIIDDEKRSLFYHPESKVVHHKMKCHLRGDDFRDLLLRGAECMEQNKATKWLSDDRNNSGTLAPDDNEWGDSVWAPRVIRAGFKFWAIVVPAHAIGSLQMRRLASEYRQRGVTVEIFASLETAFGWLEPLE
jgi:hypothetical protein